MSRDRARILSEVAARRIETERLPLAPNLAALFDDAVERHGDRPLWVSVADGETLSYREMGRQVHRATAALQALGVGQGTHVAVMLPSVPAMVIAWMALARLGAVMIPVNTRYTAREFDHVLAHGCAELLVVDQAHRALLGRAGDSLPLPKNRIVVHGGPGEGFAGAWHALLAEAGAAPAPTPAAVDVASDALMTLQFTSGSSGAAKGCMLTHRYWSVIGLVRARQGPAVERLLIDMPFHYMGGQWRFLMTLLLGATAHVAPQPSLTRLLDWLFAHRIEFCSVTPALAKQPLDPRRQALALRWAGTMAMPRELIGSVSEHLGGAPVCEMYGTTETGAAIAMPPEVIWRPGSCGLAAPFRELRIVDETGRDVSDDRPGELWIKGPGLMQGYYRDEAATAAAFRDGWFRSGDLFQRDGEGFYTMLGRIKDVIRRNGENISAAELETVLQALPDIVEAAAVPVPDELRGEEVKVCIRLRDGLSRTALPPERVYAHCAERLARFKLPRYIAYYDELPKTPSGKIAKPALRTARDPRAGAYDTADGVWR
jgi:acyl-CoA synthetase (AMP-forming)/AMP-acid ligase II